nr:dna repair protein reca like 2, mitochondrial [Quercus suber]
MHLPANGIECMCSLRHLYFQSCYGLERFHEGIQRLTALRSLGFNECRSLISLPQGMKHLTALESLVILDCEKLNLMEGDDYPMRLRELFVRRLPQLESLPKWLKGSANTLQFLRITDCENLARSAKIGARWSNSLFVIRCSWEIVHSEKRMFLVLKIAMAYQFNHNMHSCSTESLSLLLFSWKILLRKRDSFSLKLLFLLLGLEDFQRDELLKFMGERHLEKQYLPFISSRKLKILEVHTNFVLLYFVIDVLGYCAYLDVETAMDSSLVESMGINIENLLISCPISAENLLSVVNTLTRSGAIDVIVVDSVAALVPQCELDHMIDAIVPQCELCHMIGFNQVRARPKSGRDYGHMDEVTCGQLLSLLILRSINKLARFLEVYGVTLSLMVSMSQNIFVLNSRKTESSAAHVN